MEKIGSMDRKRWKDEQKKRKKRRERKEREIVIQ